jgi:hypothetical protein
LVELGVVESISHECVRAELQKNQPHRWEQWVIPPEQNAEFVAAMEAERQTLYPDGSVELPPQWRRQTPQQIRALVESDKSTPADLNRPPLSANRCRLFDAFVTDLEKAGIAVEIVLVPPFPAAFDHLQQLHKEAQLPFPILECEAYVRALAKNHPIQIDGSFDPRVAKVKEEEFIDYIHMRRNGLARLIAGLLGQHVGN